MSLSNENTTYYLTDNGWIDVYSKTDFASSKRVNPVPAKYYMICEYREEQSCMQARMKTNTQILFEDTNEKEKIQELIRKYGTCPQYISP